MAEYKIAAKVALPAALKKLLNEADELKKEIRKLQQQLIYNDTLQTHQVYNRRGL